MTEKINFQDEIALGSSLETVNGRQLGVKVEMDCNLFLVPTAALELARHGHTFNIIIMKSY